VYRCRIVPKWAIQCTEVVCTEMVMYRSGPNPHEQAPGLQFIMCSVSRDRRLAAWATLEPGRLVGDDGQRTADVSRLLFVPDSSAVRPGSTSPSLVVLYTFICDIKATCGDLLAGKLTPVNDSRMARQRAALHTDYRHPSTG